MKSFWQLLPKPFFCLAPMDDVTDVVFREVVGKTYPPDVFYTEFTNVEALQSKGREKQIGRFKLTQLEHPIVAQIWGLNPENYYKTAKEIGELGFDGIDINMGCPEKGACKSGSCSALIKNPSLAKEIIEAVKKGAGGLPISVKTRLGYEKIQTEEWIGFLLNQDLDAIIIHGRTKKEMSKVEPHWDEIKKAVALRNKMGVRTPIIGNGDIENYEDGLAKSKETGVDGIMIGRGIFKDLWCFAPPGKKPTPSIEEMFDLLLFHARLFIKTWGEDRKNPEYKPFVILRRFFKIYVSGLKTPVT
jgi:tRNA-dihydrouridine synthase